MKIGVFLLIGYVSCTLNCEVIKLNIGNKTLRVKKVVNSYNPVEPPRGLNITENTLTTDTTEPSRDLNRTDIVTVDAAKLQQHYNQTEDGTIDAVESPRDSNITKDVEKTGTVEPTRISNKKENIVTTHAAESPNDLYQTDDVVTINAAESLNDTRKLEEYVGTTLKPEMISKTYVMASKALIQQLDWSNSTPSVHYEDPPEDTNQSGSTDFPDIIESYVIASRALIHKLEWLNTTLPVSTAQPTYEDTTKMYEKISRNYINTTKADDAHELNGLSSPLSDHAEQSEYKDTTEMLEKISRNYITTTKLQEIHELGGLNSTFSGHTEQSEYEDTTEMLEKISRNYIKTTKPQETQDLDGFSSNKTKTTMQLKFKVSDKGPGIIKVEDALKILELSKSKYALASIALIQRLEWLRSTYNVTELMLDHKVDVNQFTNAQNSQNAARILRTNVEDEFMWLKNAILDVSSKLGKMIVTDQ